MAATSDAERIDQRIAGGTRRLDCEREELGYTTAEVAGELCKRWRCPEAIQRGVAQAADPLSFGEFDPLAACVHLAEELCVLKAKDIIAHDVPAALPTAVVERLGFDAAQLQQIAFRVYDSESGLESLAA